MGDAIILSGGHCALGHETATFMSAEGGNIDDAAATISGPIAGSNFIPSIPEETAVVRISRLKGILLDPASSLAEMCMALEELRAFGGLTNAVLRETKIGKTVNNVAMTSPEKAVRNSAGRLVQEWKDTCRKRSASSAGLGEEEAVALKPRSSCSASLDSEAPAPCTPPAAPSELAADIKRLKATLDEKALPGAELKKALDLLKAIPTAALRGVPGVAMTVNSVATTSSVDEDVQASARELMQHWKQLSAARKLKSNINASSVSSDGEASKSSSPQLRPAEFIEQLEKSSSVSADKQKDSLPEKMVKDQDRAKVLQPLLKELAKVKCDSESWDRLADFLHSQSKLEEYNYLLLNKNKPDPVHVAADIEGALFNELGCKPSEYMTQARSVLYNLRDKANRSFGFKLMCGYFKPQQVPRLSTHDMASDEKNAERAKQHEEDMLLNINQGRLR